MSRPETRTTKRSHGGASKRFAGDLPSLTRSSRSGNRHDDPRFSRGRPQRARVIAGVVSAIVVVLVACAAAYAQFTPVGVIQRSPNTATNDKNIVVMLKLAHAGGLDARTVRATLDGKPMPAGNAHLGGDLLIVPLPHVKQGTHTLHIRSDRFGLLRRKLDTKWSFVVDRVAPRLKVLGPVHRLSPIAAVSILVHGEPGARVTGEDSLHARLSDIHISRGGTATISGHLPDGKHRIAIVARDNAGNESRHVITVMVDTTPPVVKLTLPSTTLTSATPSVAFSATDADGFSVRASFDSDAATVTHAATGAYSVRPADKLAEGTHSLTITVTDKLGHVTKIERNVLVDSTETLGDNAIGLGARGADVVALEKQLIAHKLMKDTGAGARELARGVYGKSAAAAVTRFQNAHGLTPDGVAGASTIAAMTLHIVIDRGQHTLTLYRLGKVEASYTVAVGQAKYPTPTGNFHIIDMQKDPTWTPPNDAWAKGAKPIGPGPGNPLGTRWMGINYPGVGMHGTDEPASIGYSLSHGCVRMHIPDAEDLFSRVQVGTPVTIMD